MTGLFNLYSGNVAESTSNDTYLGTQNIATRARTALELPRVRVALGMKEGERITRPSLGSYNLQDTVDMVRFMVHENFDCFFNCPPYGLAQTIGDVRGVNNQLPLEEIGYTTASRVTELISIYSGAVPEGKHVWITWYPSEDEHKATFREWRHRNKDRIPSQQELENLAGELGLSLKDKNQDSLFISNLSHKMLETFIVWIRSTPQNETDKEKFISDFQYFYSLTTKSNDNK